jgi:hypothetical protein
LLKAAFRLLLLLPFVPDATATLGFLAFGDKSIPKALRPSKQATIFQIQQTLKIKMILEC